MAGLESEGGVNEHEMTLAYIARLREHVADAEACIHAAKQRLAELERAGLGSIPRTPTAGNFMAATPLQTLWVRCMELEKEVAFQGSSGARGMRERAAKIEKRNAELMQENTRLVEELAAVKEGRAL